MTMYDPNEKDMLAALGSMARTSVDRCWGNKVEARERMKEWLTYDRRFENFDHDKLVDRVTLRSNGAVVELFDDPELLKGGSPRPLQRSKW
jgi:hypothetical protein